MSDVLPAPFLHRDVPGSEVTVREILQQPDVWREAAANTTERRAALDAFLEPFLADPAVRIVLTGAGTSAFAGDAAAAATARATGRRVDAIATTTIVATPHDAFVEDVPTVLVSFARSGNSPESVAATELADQLLTDVRHLVLTCDPAGDLARRHADRPDSFVMAMPARANDQGFAMTSSFTSMLLTCLLAFGVVPASVVDALAAAGSDVLETRAADIAALADGTGPAGSGIERVVYLGSGPFAGLAHESALKLLELTAGRIVTYFDTPMGFRHGPKAVLDDTTLVVVYVSEDPYARRYDLDLLAELRRTIGPERVIAVTASALSDATTATTDWVLPGLTGVPDVAAAIPFVVVAQVIGLSFSLALGTTPDDPFPGNEVNRVVQGVVIHPLDDGAARIDGGAR